MRIHGGNQSTLKEMNRQLILNTISKTPMSCSELSTHIGLSNTGVVTLVEELIKEKVLIKTDALETSIGRRPILISINPDYAVVVIVTFLRNIEIKFCSIDGNDLHHCAIKVQDHVSVEDVQLAISDIQKIFTERFSTFKLLNICIAVPGKVDKFTGEFIYAPHFQDYHQINLKEMFVSAFHVAVELKNDLKFAILAEKAYGDFGSEINNTMYLQICTGFGCSFFIDGKLYEGSHGLTGEIGSYIVDSLNSLNDFSFEHDMSLFAQLCSYENVLKVVKQKSTSGISGFDMEKFDMFNMLDCYTLNEPICTEVINKTAKITGNIILNLLQVLDFQNVIISKATMLFGQKYVDEIEKHVNEKSNHLKIQIKLSSFSRDGVMLGCKYHALNLAYKYISENKE